MEAGTQVGAYRVLQQIGKGGMGTVWLAEHTMLGRRAALKLLHPMFTMRPEIVTRFFNEARAATAISDPGIVQIFDYGHHVDGTAYIAMEMLEGEPLDRRLKRMGRLPITDALRIMRQVASTLGVAHRSGIVHRDLKPENVFLVHDPEVIGGERAKILDFGIAKLTSDTNVVTNTSAVMGTPAYMSPEQCRGAGRVDHRADVYSVGCTLFALITGGPPFDVEGSGEIIAAHLREPPPAPSSRVGNVPPEIDALILRCLAKDPARRFASGTELASAIGALIGTASNPAISSASVPPSPRAASASLTTLSAATGAPRTSPVRSSRILAAAAAALLLGGGVTALVMTRREPARPSEPHVTLPIPASPAPAAAATEPPAPPPEVAKPLSPEGAKPSPESARPSPSEVAKPSPESARPSPSEVAKPSPESARPTSSEVAKPSPESARPTSSEVAKPSPESARPTSSGSRQAVGVEQVLLRGGKTIVGGHQATVGAGQAIGEQACGAISCGQASGQTQDAVAVQVQVRRHSPGALACQSSCVVAGCCSR
ncbi:MAG: hypothetical protein E6J91_26720 [Deltaproteobacteria bacterium]|nr:MAG: hypothetical protein E6J91_26720 [Deltaproteobacteria bacterium]